MVHRNNYRHWTQEVCSPAKIEILRPNLDWRIIWMETAALPNNIRETKFSTNRNLDTVVYSNEIETLIR